MTYGFHNQPVETASLNELRCVQDSRLKKIVRYVYSNNPVFRSSFDNAGIDACNFKGLSDLATLPTMSKDNFREGYPLAMCCVDRKNIVEMHMSSGSTGTPVVMPYTRRDINQWGECMARCYRMAGAQMGDVVQITPSFGLFNGGFGFYHGAHQAGLFVVPTGAGNTPRQIKLMQDFGTQVLTGVVSYGVRIMEVMAELKQTVPSLKIGIFGAEVFSESLKKKLSSSLGIEVFDIYGMTETGGVGTLGLDCCDHSGIHVWEDHYIIEIIDQTTGNEAAQGQLGELVLTSLTREALPVIRFKTGDLTRVLSRDKCACGRTHLRIAPIAGRVDDMLIVKGVNFFPKQVEQALMAISGVGSNYQIIVEEVDGVKDVRINVEAEPSVTGFMVEKVLKEALGFSPKGDVFQPGQLPRQEGKAKRVFYKDAQGNLR